MSSYFLPQVVDHDFLKLLFNLKYEGEKGDINKEAIGQMSRVFANSPGDWGSITGWVIQKT